jgi:hypothetical protein
MVRSLSPLAVSTHYLKSQLQIVWSSPPCGTLESCFGIDLTDGHPRLKQFYAAFKVRPSAVVPGGGGDMAITVD